MKKSLLLSLSFLLMIGCTKNITPELQNAAPQVVIIGTVSDTSDNYVVSISQTVGFYEDHVLPGISGAQVTITDLTSGLLYVLPETLAGVYVTHANIPGIPGHTYSMQVLLNGKTYTATSTMPSPVALDSVSFDTGDTAQIKARIYFQAPPGIANYYKYALAINGRAAPRFETFEDRLSDGRFIQDRINADTSEIVKRDIVKVSLVGIDRHVYQYLSEAESIAYDNGSLAAPTRPASNITGGCLGYFSAQTISSKTAVVIF